MPSSGSGKDYDSSERDPFSLCYAVVGEEGGHHRIVASSLRLAFRHRFDSLLFFFFGIIPVVPLTLVRQWSLFLHPERTSQSFHCSQFPGAWNSFSKLLLVFSSLHYLSNVIVCSSFYDDFIVCQFHCFDNSQTSAQSPRLIMLFIVNSILLFRNLYITSTFSLLRRTECFKFFNFPSILPCRNQPFHFLDTLVHSSTHQKHYSCPSLPSWSSWSLRQESIPKNSYDRSR